MNAINELKIMFWNAQGITTLSKQLQLEFFIEREKIDILLLAETFLTPNHSFQLKNYTIHRNDRLANAHGGVAIAVRNTISYNSRLPFDTMSIENIAIVLSINPKQTIHFANDIKVLTSTNKQFLIFGDLNAKHTSWNCNINNRLGNLLFNAQQENPFMIFYTNQHTHYSHSGQTPSTIDLLI